MSLQCALAEPFEKRWFYHLSDDAKYNRIFIDLVIRDIIQRYNVENEDLWIQSDNALFLHKNKLQFYLYQQLSDSLIYESLGRTVHQDTAKALLMQCPFLVWRMFFVKKLLTKTSSLTPVKRFVTTLQYRIQIFCCNTWWYLHQILTQK